MAAYAHDLDDQVRECANCGAVEGLLRCSRCRKIWFCSLKCQKGYWPVHKPECKSNEFADAIEQKDPKFAAWLRNHGKQAVLKDDEVDRLERAGKAAQGPSREEVMESMYGQVAPKPKEASYSAEERKRMKHRQEAEALEARQRSGRDKIWAAVVVDSELGMDCGNFKWQQNQSYIEIFCRVPDNVPTHEVQIELQPARISIVIGSHAILTGQLFAKIKCEESTWYISEGVATLTLLKANRRGNYADGCNNAHTFWRALLKSEPQNQTLKVENPPVSYYSSYWEAAPAAAQTHQVAGRRSARLAAA